MADRGVKRRAGGTERAQCRAKGVHCGGASGAQGFERAEGAEPREGNAISKRARDSEPLIT